MAEQSKTSSQSTLQRLKPLLDVIGAILIFGSWIATNTLSQRAQERATFHQGMIDRVRQFQLYEDFASSIVEIKADLARTSNLVEYTARHATSLQDDPGPPPTKPVWTGITSFQVREIKQLMDEIDSYAVSMSASGDIQGSIDQAKMGIRELSDEFRSARAEYEELVEATKDSSKPPSEGRHR